ncbi:MAG: fused response regulator/phosphatase [Thiomicrorhabdus sp.]|nr:fused response regulator/phosphatase [Thiomicrorhabdus sp.]
MLANLTDNQQKRYIFAVDDEPINRLLLEDLIESRYELNVVDSGQACLASVKERLPELILLDISMPNMDGFEVCRLLKQDPVIGSVPIIFLTARISIEDERKGLLLGAVDYITKPFSESILLARIETHVELNRTHTLLEQSYASVKKDQDYIEYIMQTMREDERFSADSLAMAISPVERSNGDIVLSALAPNGHRHLLIGDFTGHGLSAAIAGPLVSSLFYIQTEQGISLDRIIERINLELFYKLPAEVFMAAVWLDWNPQTNQVTLWNCGMPPVLHFRGGEKIAQYDSVFLPLGIQACLIECMPPSQIISCRSNDTLFGYSDGVLDVRDASGDLYGQPRLEALLHQVVVFSKEVVTVVTALEDYANGTEIKDDITLVQLTIS